MLHVERQAEHDGLPLTQGARHRAQRVLARGAGRMQPLRHGADRAHHLGLLDIEIILHGAVRHVAGQHHERCPAFRCFTDPGQRVGEARSRMHTDEGEFAARLRIGVGHARGIAFMPSGNQFDAGLCQRVGHLEIGGAKKREAASCAVASEVARNHIGDNGVPPAHRLPRSAIRKNLYRPKP